MCLRFLEIGVVLINMQQNFLQSKIQVPNNFNKENPYVLYRKKDTHKIYIKYLLAVIL